METENKIAVKSVSDMRKFSKRRDDDEYAEKENVLPKEKRIVRILDGAITTCLSFIFFGVPLFFTGLTLQGIVFEKQIYFYFWILLALVFWAIKGMILGEMRIRKTPLDIPIFVFWLVYLLATIFSVDRWHSFWGSFGDPSRGLISLTTLIVGYYIILSHFTARRLKWMLGALIASGSLVAIWSFLGIFQIPIFPDAWKSVLPISTIGSISGLGFFLSFIVPILLAAIFKVKESEEMKAIRVVGMVFLFLILILSLVDIFSLYSFVSWISLIIGMAVFVIYLISRIIVSKANWVWLPVAVFILLMTFLMVGNINLARMNLPAEISPSLKLSWDIAKASIKDKPFLGTGPASYGFDFSHYRPQYFNSNAFYNLRFFQASGLIFEAASTLGVIGTIALITLLLSFVGVVIYLLNGHREKDKIYSLGLAVSSLIFLISAATERVEGSIILLGIIISSLALAVLLEENSAERRFMNLSVKASPKYALALAFIFIVISAGVVFLFIFLGKAYMADIDAGFSAKAIGNNNNRAVSKITQAIGLFGKESRYYTQAGQIFMTMANDEAMKGVGSQNLNAIQSDLNNSIAYAKTGADMDPNDVTAAESLAQIYENAGFYIPNAFSLAQDEYNKSLSLEPYNPNFYLQLGQIQLSLYSNSKNKNQQQGFLNQAKAFFQKSINEKNDFASAYYQLALTEEALGNLDSAINNMSKAFNDDNGNVNYDFNLGRLYQKRGNADDLKAAEKIYDNILSIEPNEINTLLNLGFLYEKTGRKDEAINEYQKVESLLPNGQGQIRTQIESMINNVKSGIENNPQDLNLANNS